MCLNGSSLMKVHYFQRYHSKENVATANTMLLLSRLYSYSPEKFFKLLKSEIFSDIFEPEMTFRMQERNKNSVPDATITQEGFKVIVEAKMTDWFYEDQLMRHLLSLEMKSIRCWLRLLLYPWKKGKNNLLRSN